MGRERNYFNLKVCSQEFTGNIESLYKIESLPTTNTPDYEEVL